MAGPALGERHSCCFSRPLAFAAVRARGPHDSRRDAGATKAPALQNFVCFFWQAGDANAGVALVANIEADQERGDLFQDARIFQFAAINGAHAGNFCRQRSYRRRGVGVVAADNDVAVNGSIAIQDLGGRVMERGHYRHSRWHEFGSLLCRGTLPDAQSAGGPAAHAGGKRHSGVNHDAAFRDRRLDLLEQGAVAFKRDGEHQQIGGSASGAVFVA